MKAKLPCLSLSLLICGATALTAFAATDSTNSAGTTTGPQHLANQWQNGMINVEAAWDKDYTGAGVVIGLLGQFVDWAHPAIAGAYNSNLSIDYMQGDSTITDPSKMYTNEVSGTFQAALAVGGGNIKGVAYGATIAGYHVATGAGGQVNAEGVIDALTRHSGLGSFTTNDAGVYTGAKYVSEPQTRIFIAPWGGDSQVYNTENLTAAAGIKSLFSLVSKNNTILVQDAGAMRNKDVFKDGVSTTGQLNGDALVNGDVIYAAGATQKGVFSPKGSFGSALFITAPGDNVYSAVRKSTSSTTSGSDSGSSSSKVIETYGSAAGTMDGAANVQPGANASAIVAGVLALGAQGNQAMDVRWAKHALARSSVILDSMANRVATETDAGYNGWQTNAAGLSFSNDYGFGMVDAAKFVEASKNIAYVSVAGTENVDLTSNRSFTKTDAKTLTANISKIVSTQKALESVELTINLQNVDILGKLVGGNVTKGTSIVLKHTSDSGYVTTSELLSTTYNNSNSSVQENWSWTFVSNAFWGESTKGKWELEIVYKDNFGTSSVQVNPDLAKIVSASLKFNTGEIKNESDISGVYNSQVLEVRSFVWDSKNPFEIDENSAMNAQDAIVLNEGTLVVNGVLGSIDKIDTLEKGSRIFVNNGTLAVGESGQVSTARGTDVLGGELKFNAGGSISGGVRLYNGAINIAGGSTTTTLGSVDIYGGTMSVWRESGSQLASLQASVTMRGGELNLSNCRGITVAANAGTTTISSGTVAGTINVGTNDYWESKTQDFVTSYTEDGEALKTTLTYDQQSAATTAGKLVVNTGTTYDGTLTVTGTYASKNILKKKFVTVGTGRKAEQKEVYEIVAEDFEYRPYAKIAGTITGILTSTYADLDVVNGANLKYGINADLGTHLQMSGEVKSEGNITLAQKSNLTLLDGLQLSMGNNALTSKGTTDVLGSVTITSSASEAVNFSGEYIYHIGSLLTLKAATGVALPQIKFENVNIKMDISFSSGILPIDQIQFVKVQNSAGTNLENQVVVGDGVNVKVKNAPMLYVGNGREEMLNYEIDTATGNLVLTSNTPVTPLRLTYSEYTPEQKAILGGLRTCLTGEANAGMSADLVQEFDGNEATGVPAMTTVVEVTAALDQFLPVNLKTIATLHNKQANAVVSTIERRSRELRVGAPVSDVWAQPLFSSYGFSYSVNPGLLASTSFRQFDLINYTTPYMAWMNGGHSFSDGKNVKHTGSTETKLSNFALGFDYAVFDTLSVGMFVGYLDGETKILNTDSSTTAQVRNIGVYAAGSTTDSIGSTYYSAMLSYGMAEYDMKRTTQIGSYRSTATGSPDGSQAIAYISAGYEWDAGSHALSYQWTTGPSISLRYVYNSVDGYSEEGRGIDAFKNDDFDYSSLLLTLGWRTTVRFDIVGFCTMVPEFRVNYNHEFIDDGKVDTAFIAAPNSKFSTDLNHEGRDYFTLGVGNTFLLTDHFTVSFDYDCSVAREDSKPEHSFNVMARARF